MITRNIKHIFKAGMLFIITLFVLSCSERVATVDKPNIIILFADDLGYGDLGCYGHPNIRTPHLDKMAAEGARLTSFYSAAAVCTPSRAALLTGRYPIRHLPHNLGPESKNGLPLTELTIADILKKEGYRTMAIGKWHLGHSPDYLPTRRGFDHYYGLPYSNDMIPPWVKTDVPLNLYVDGEITKVVNYDQENLTIDCTEQALEFIKTSEDRPFFLYVPYSMPHLPVSTSKEFQNRSAAGLYGDVIETIDWSVGKILEALKDLEIDEHTLVVFTSDNGPWLNLPDRMLQRGVKPWHGGSPGLLRGSKATTWEGGMRVPGIFRWPGIIPAGLHLTDPATTMDLFTTCAKIGGGNIPKDRVIDGHNILPFLQGKKPSPTQTFFYFRGERLEAVRHDEWKYSIQGKEKQLFNLKVDPSEKYNVIDSFPDVASDLERLIAEFE